MGNGMHGQNVELLRTVGPPMVFGKGVEPFVLVMMMSTPIQKLLFVLKVLQVETVQSVKMTTGRIQVVTA